LDNQNYILGILVVLLIILVVLVVVLIDSYRPVIKDEPSFSSNSLRADYNYQQIQSYLEDNSWKKKGIEDEDVAEQDEVNKVGTALLLYLEDNQQLPESLSDLLGKYLVKLPSKVNSLNYINNELNLIETINTILRKSKFVQDKTLAFRPYSLLVDSLDKRIYLLQGKKQVKAYPIGVGGRENPTPKGEFRIKNKLKLSGKDQKIYGDYWLGIDLWTKGGGYGIHGSTNQLPVSEQKSKGCIRMRAEDLEQLYRLIPLRTKIVIR